MAGGSGLEIEILDEKDLAALGCGGMLGVNAGSSEPPRLVKLRYRPKDDRGKPVKPTGRLSLVGKGIMYDSGGISLKPNDLVHAAMKTDMSGAAAILAAMSALALLSCMGLSPSLKWPQHPAVLAARTRLRGSGTVRGQRRALAGRAGRRASRGTETCAG